jgi:hypothetical protein
VAPGRQRSRVAKRQKRRTMTSVIVRRLFYDIII